MRIAWHLAQKNCGADCRGVASIEAEEAVASSVFLQTYETTFRSVTNDERQQREHAISTGLHQPRADISEEYLPSQGSLRASPYFSSLPRLNTDIAQHNCACAQLIM